LEVQPRAAVGDHAGREQQLARAVGLAAVVVEEHARRAVQLGNDDALGAVDDEGAVLGHERDLAHVHFLLLHVLDRLARRLAVVDHQAHGHAQRRAVAHAALAALALVEHRLAELVADVLQRGVAVVADDREHRLERGVQALVLALAGLDVRLQELAVGVDLDREQERHLEDRAALAEVLADALLLGERVIRLELGSRHGGLMPRSWARADARPGKRIVVTGQSLVLPAPARPLLLLTTDNCWSGGSAAGRRGADTGGGPPPYNDRRPETCVPSLGSHRRARPGGHTVAAASVCARLRANLFLLLVPAGGGELPRPGVRVEVAAARGARGRPGPWRHLTSTVAPAASRSFLIFSASSFEAPSFTVPPASVRSLASFRPRPVMARTTLMTSTFFS